MIKVFKKNFFKVKIKLKMIKIKFIELTIDLFI